MDDDEILECYSGESFEFTKASLVAFARRVISQSADVMPTPAPGQCPMCGEYSMAARAHQGLYGVKVEL